MTMAIAVMALVAIVIVIVASGWNNNQHTDAGSVAVRVVPGARLPVADSVDQSTSVTQLQDRIEPMAGLPAGDIAAMEQAMAVGRRDQRTAGDELRLVNIIRTALPDLSSSTVTCAGVICRISGRLSAAGGSPREYLRSVEFSDAIFALGYSPGPNQFGQTDAGSPIVLYLRREN